MNKTKTILWVVIVIVVIAGVWYEKNKKLEEKVIRIGTIYQETGSGADWGEKAERGIKLAAEKINNEGGINGKAIEIIYEDSKSNVTDAVTAMTKLINVNGVKAVLSQQSGVVVALSPIANNNKIILIDTGATTPAYTSPNDFTFRVSYSASYFAKEITEYLNEKGIKTMGILYVNNDYGLAMLNAYKKYFKGKIIAAESFTQDDVDFKTQIQKIKNANPEIFVYVSDPKQAGIILKQKKELGLNQPVYTDTYAIEYQSTLSIAGDAAEGVIYVSPYYDTSRTDSVFREFNDKFLEKYGEVSNSLSAQAYDGLIVLAYAMRQCENPIDTNCIKDKLYSIDNFQFVISNITFDENGEVTERPTILKTVKNGQFVPFSE
jgi:branched-chain amino acid transport system substrate-binding protein